MDQNSASWNRLTSWLRQIDAVMRAAENRRSQRRPWRPNSNPSTLGVARHLPVITLEERISRSAGSAITDFAIIPRGVPSPEGSTAMAASRQPAGGCGYGEQAAGDPRKLAASACG